VAVVVAVLGDLCAASDILVVGVYELGYLLGRLGVDWVPDDEGV
jgi:hypothetical protein